MFLTIGYEFSPRKNRWLPARRCIDGTWKEFGEMDYCAELADILRTLQPATKVVWCSMTVRGEQQHCTINKLG